MLKISYIVNWSDDDRELLLIISLSSPGARTPIGSGSQLLNTTWHQGKEQLIEVGERQHFLQGAKMRNKYTEFLGDVFNSSEHHVISSDYNQTLMAAQSHLLGMYPLGTGPVFQDSQMKNKAVPPFEISKEASQFISQNPVLYEKYNPLPLHVIKVTNSLFKMHKSIFCSIIDQIVPESFEDAQSRSKKSLYPLYDQMEKVWGIKQEYLTLDQAYPYLNAYQMVKVNDSEIENDLSTYAKNSMNKYWWTYYYDGYFGNPRTSQLVSTEFLNYIIKNLNEKVKADKGDQTASEFHQNIKNIMLFVESEVIVAGIIAALDKHDSFDHGPPLASLTIIELFKRGNTYYMKWEIDGENLKIGSKWNSIGEWELTSALSYISSLLVDDLEKSCVRKGREDTSTFPLWAIITIVVWGLFFIGWISGCWSWYISLRPPKGREEYDEYDSDEEEESFASFKRQAIND